MAIMREDIKTAGGGASRFWDTSGGGYQQLNPITFQPWGDPSPPYTSPAGQLSPVGDVLGASPSGGDSPPADTDIQKFEKIGEENMNPSQLDEYRRLTQQVQDLSAQRSAGIESAYSNYEAKLDAILNEGLPAQEQAQKQIATSQWEQGGADLSSQLTEGQELLGTQEEKTEAQQNKTLKDISSNLRNSFMAGQVYLGAQGAGDSSAANQYAYALTKMGNKQRGDVQTQTAEIMKEIGARASKLKSTYDDETNTIKREFDQKISSIAEWFANQQNTLRINQGQLGISKASDLQAASQHLLDIAIGEMNTIKTEQANRRDKLETWATNNATNIQQLRQNMQGITGQSLANVPQAQQIVGQPTMSGGNISAKSAYTPGPGYTSTTEEKPLFNPSGYNNFLASQTGGPLL